MSKVTTCPQTGAIIFEHIYQVNGSNIRTAIVNTNPNAEVLDGLTYVYTSYAHPKRAQKHIDDHSYQFAVDPE